MAKRSFLSFLRSPFSGGDTTTFLNLEYSQETKEDGDHTDVSQVKIEDKDFTSPKIHLSGGNPEVPIIGIGGAGLRILDKVVERLESYEMEYTTMGIDTDKADLDKYSRITHKFHVPGSDLGTAHQYRLGATRAQKVKNELKEEIRKYIRDIDIVYSHEIVFLLLGAGGTGVGVGIEIAKILQEIGKRPVPFMILPTKEEMSRIKFNAAVGLYNFSYGPKDRCLNLTTVCIDNALLLDWNSDQYFTSVMSAINERVAATLGDIIASTVKKSHAYSADLNDFFEIFRDLKSIGTLQYLHIKNPSKQAAEILDQHLEDSISLEVDIYSATRAYFFMSTKIQQISATEYRNLMLNFDNADVFNKLYEVETDEEYIAIRGIYTGLTYPTRIKNLMNLAEDARIEILNKELDGKNTGTVNPKIDKLQSDEQINVKSGEEVIDERAKEYAKMKREGDK